MNFIAGLPEAQQFALLVLVAVPAAGAFYFIAVLYWKAMLWLAGKIPAKAPSAATYDRVTSPYRLNRDATAAVSTDTYWEHDMTTCPRGVKVLMLGSSGVALLGQYNGDKFFVGWHALPRKRVA